MQITFTQALEGFELYCQARRLSKHTLSDYFTTYRKFSRWLDDDPPLETITRRQITQFIAAQPVSAKTALNYHTGLSALWTWALKENLVHEHTVRRVDPPEPEKRTIAPYTQADLQAMLNSLERTNKYKRPGKKASNHSLPNVDRNRAIILLLLDTGMRASELAEAKINQLDLRNRRIRVFGKGAKERTLPFVAQTGQAIWRYLLPRKDEPINAPLFEAAGRTLTRTRLTKQLQSIGEHAGVHAVTCHRFRHTFAITYLRNGGDPYTLQILLGHTSMDMVKRYLSIAQADIEARHHHASPVANWNL
ncbi:MAG: hypothetical protein C4540_02450 [Candidatus Omnitrophota bacterium]|jgi:site-specific recombinase XerD|nr:MAG: hypothetical protein C4540_02450 [Candidatus Omnitrophota bacterium]